MGFCIGRRQLYGNGGRDCSDSAMRQEGTDYSEVLEAWGTQGRELLWDWGRGDNGYLCLHFSLKLPNTE